MVGIKRCLLAAAMAASLLGTAYAASQPAVKRAVTASAAAPANTRRLMRGDVIQITVDDEADLTRTATISAAGTVSLGYMGEAEVAGLTLPEAAAAIRKTLQRYVRRPVVSVTLAESRFSVMGAVQHPGQFVMPGDQIALLDALAQAGGPVDKANLRTVLLIRQTPSGPVKTRVDVQAAMTGQAANSLPLLQSGDTLYVEKRRDSLGTRILTMAGALASVAWILRR